MQSSSDRPWTLLLATTPCSLGSRRGRTTSSRELGRRVACSFDASQSVSWQTREFAYIATSSMWLAGRPLGNFARIDRADYQDATPLCPRGAPAGQSGVVALAFANSIF